MTNVRTINYTELLLRAKLLMYKTTMMTPSMAIKLKYYPIKQQAACIHYNYNNNEAMWGNSVRFASVPID